MLTDTVADLPVTRFRRLVTSSHESLAVSIGDTRTQQALGRGMIGGNGTKVQLWEHMDAGKNQWWILTTIPEGYLRIQNVQSSRYLDADKNTAGHDGTVVRLWEYAGGAKTQWWR